MNMYQDLDNPCANFAAFVAKQRCESLMDFSVPLFPWFLGSKMLIPCSLNRGMLLAC